VSIRIRLLFLVLGAVLLPAILVGLRYYQDRGNDIAAAIGGLTATAHAITSDINAKVQGTAQLHFGLSRASDLVAHDKASCSSFLSEVREKNPQYTGILTIEPDGSLFCDSLQTGRSLDLRDRAYFKQALNINGSVVIEPVFGRLTGAAVLQIAFPARDESQRLLYVLLASLDLTKLMKEQTDKLPEGFELLLVDRKGTVLAWSPVRLRADRPGTSIAGSPLFRFAAEKSSLTKELVNPSGESQVWAAADTLLIGGVNLYVMVGRSLSELVASPNRRLAEDSAILVILSIVLFAGVWMFAELGIRFQISRIASMAERLGAGDLRARVLPPYPRGELGSLITVLNGTADSLERQRCNIEDLNEKLRHSQRLEALEAQRLDIAVNNMPLGLLLYDEAQRITVCNQRYIEMYGLSTDIVKPGCSFRDLIAHRKQIGSFNGNIDEYCSSVLSTVARGKVSRSIAQATDGRSIEYVNQPLASGGWITTMEDISERKRSEERITHLAHYDALTDLPNRALFREQLDHALNGVRHGAQLALFYIDIDQFKSVNDSLGHSVGDELLRAVAARLQACLRSTEFVARLGGDEFAIIQTAVASKADTSDLVARIYQAISEPIDCVGQLLIADFSVGVALAPQDGTDPDQLLKNADLAMYDAKADGRRTYRFFEPRMDARARALHALELDLRKAIADGGFELHYQPVVNLLSNKVTGCEALLRWFHPILGAISPAEFIPVAEETGLINQLGDWVLTRACAEAATWPDQIKVAVNVSPIQFRSQALALKVAAALAASGLPAHRLELEVTETVLIRDDDVALTMLHHLRALGVRIALDDFGTGYSSLKYLQQFPFDKIKIDRCFIKDVAESEGSACIVQAVVTIAGARRMQTTAEGVETEEQRQMLVKLGCTEMQGYLFRPAMPATEIAQLLWLPGERAAAVL
jgi:diguanylate cyclase (GGDEF)-like protein